MKIEILKNKEFIEVRRISKNFINIKIEHVNEASCSTTLDDEKVKELIKMLQATL